MVATATTGSGASGTPGQVFTGLGGAAATTASSSGKKSGAQSNTLDIGRTYGLAVVFAGVFAGFALVM